MYLCVSLSPVRGATCVYYLHSHVWLLLALVSQDLISSSLGEILTLGRVISVKEEGCLSILVSPDFVFYIHIPPPDLALVLSTSFQFD